LGILSALSVNESLTFIELKKLWTLQTEPERTRQELEEAGYVTCTKTFEGRIPKSDYRLAAAGRAAWTGIWITWKH